MIIFCVKGAPFTDAEIKEILNAHNIARAAKCQAPLEWDAQAAVVANNYASTCPSGHNSNRDSQYLAAGGTCKTSDWPYCGTSVLGENIAWMTSGSLTSLVDLWNEEEQQWVCNKLPSYQTGCGHYTQVVWSGTKKVGCGRQYNCQGMTILVCDYFPPGNFNPSTTHAFPVQYCTPGSCSGVPTSAISTTTSTKSTTTKTTSTPIPTTSPSPTPTPVPVPTNNLKDWRVVNGSINNWSYGNYALSHKNDNIDTMSMIGSSSSAIDYFVVSKITTTSTSKIFGIVLGYTNGVNGEQYLVFRKRNAYEVCMVYKTKQTEKCYTYTETGPSWTSSSHVLKVRYSFVNAMYKFTLYMDNYQFVTYQLPVGWNIGESGLQSQGSTTFQNFYIRTPTAVKISLTQCSLSNNNIISMIASQIGCSTSDITGLVRYGCSKKKDIEAVEVVSVVLVGTATQSSQELANNLMLNPSTQMSSVEVISESTDDMTSVNGEIIEEPLLLASEGLSAGAIAGIVIGSVAGVALLAVGGYFGYNKFKKSVKKSKPEVLTPRPDESNVEQNNKEPVHEESKKPIGSTVNIFNLDPNDPRSITARSPIVQKN
jgi:pathogenesis-related protein 1